MSALDALRNNFIGSAKRAVSRANEVRKRRGLGEANFTLYQTGGFSVQTASKAVMVSSPDESNGAIEVQYLNCNADTVYYYLRTISAKAVLHRQGDEKTSLDPEELAQEIIKPLNLET